MSKIANDRYELYNRLHNENKPVALSLKLLNKGKIKFLRLLYIPSSKAEKPRLYLAFKEKGIKTSYAPIGLITKDFEKKRQLKRFLSENPILEEEIAFVLDGCDYHDHKILTYQKVQKRRKGQESVSTLSIQDCFSGESFDYERKDLNKLCREWKKEWRLEYEHHVGSSSLIDGSIKTSTIVERCDQSITNARKDARKKYIDSRLARKSDQSSPKTQPSQRKAKRGSDRWGMPGNPYMKLQTIDLRPRLIDLVPSHSGKQLRKKITFLNEEETIQSYYIVQKENKLGNIIKERIPITVTRLKKPTHKTIRVLQLPPDMCEQYHKVKGIIENLKEVKS